MSRYNGFTAVIDGCCWRRLNLIQSPSLSPLPTTSTHHVSHWSTVTMPVPVCFGIFRWPL